jgi:hypothetical protein
MFPEGVLHRGKKILGEMHLFRGSLHSCTWELFFAWILVVFFCRWCWALLPHLEELAILEHFISDVSSHCPCIRRPRFFSLKWSFLGFCLAFDHLLEFFFFSFPFLFPPNWLLVCVVNALIVGDLDRQTHQGGTRGSRLCGEDRDRETENSKVCARTRDTRFIQVRVAKVANPTSCLGDQVWRPALGVGWDQVSG